MGMKTALIIFEKVGAGHQRVATLIASMLAEQEDLRIVTIAGSELFEDPSVEWINRVWNGLIRMNRIGLADAIINFLVRAWIVPIMELMSTRSYHAKLDEVAPSLIICTADGFSISDTLDGAREVLPVSIRFLCAPGLEITRGNATVSIAGEAGHLVDLSAPEGFSAAVASVEFSPRFGERTATRQIVFSGALAPGAVAFTGVRPVAAKATARIVKPGNVVEAAWAKEPAAKSQDVKTSLTGSQS